MDPIRFGGDIRLLRHHRGWTQARLAGAAAVSRWVIVEIEAGCAAHIAVEQLARVAAALGAYLSGRLLYRGEGLDRLRDRRHAGLVDRMVARLQADGWEVATEI